MYAFGLSQSTSDKLLHDSSAGNNIKHKRTQLTMPSSSASLAQQAARQSHNLKVASSILAGSIFLIHIALAISFCFFI